MVETPIYVVIKDCGETLRFDSWDYMLGYLEAVDVANDEYDIWDARGRVVTLRAIGLSPIHTGTIALKSVSEVEDLELVQKLSKDARLEAPITEKILKKVEMLIKSDKFHDECGVVAIYAHPEASTLAYLGMHALQHRGQESAGMASSNGTTIFVQKAMGLVMDIFNEETLSRLPGSLAIGHTRYSTTGDSA